ncbi:MAG: ATP-binding protein, partial [Terriglobales bacterium]
VLDVTAHRQLQAQLLHSQKMDAIGQLAGGIAHDFNNLLMVIRSYAEMAAESREAGGLRAQGAGRMAQGPGLVPQDSSDETLKRQLDAIMKAADRGAALTRQLLTFGRKQTFSPRVMELNSVLENMTRVLPRALGEDVRVELRAAPGLWQVKADPVQIEQLVLNLAVNARDAMPSGGRLTIETDNTVLDSDYVKLHAGVTPGEYVMLAVSDTGHGIAPDVLPRIFEPFFTTKERGKGTGLGLPTVYGIVQQCGGFVWVYSEVGQGTVFKIYLPRNGAGAASTSTPAPAKPVRISGSETILIVEDEEAVRCATRDYLARCGYRVFEAASGEEALRSSDQHRGTINLLITDGVMPGMSGMALAQEISERRPGIRILCVSGYTEASMSAHGLSADTAFLQKPFSLAALAAKVRELLDAQPHQHAA